MPRRRSSPLRTSIALGAAALTVGCHTYTPVTVADLAPSRVVRIDLTDAGSAGVGPTVGPFAVALDGRITARDDSLLLVSVSQVTRRSGAEETWTGEVVRVPRSGVASLSVETLSRSRTTFLLGGLVALGAAVGAGLGGGAGAGGRTGGAPPGGTK